MRKKIRKTFNILLLSVLMASNFLIPSYAVTSDEPYTEPDASTRANINVIIKSPEIYEGTLEFYCGMETYYLAVKEGDTETVYTLDVPYGKSHIGFLDPDDTTDSFTINYDHELDTEKEDTVTATIAYAKNTSEVSENEINAPDDIDMTASPSEIDYSDGQESGILHVKCTYYGSFDSVTYRMMNGERVYDITLDQEHNFEANVRFPVGTYRELSNIDVEENALTSITDDISFAFGHRNNEGYFGNNYEITKNGYTSVDDLYIKMNYKGDMREVDDEILMTTKINEQYTNLRNEKRNEFLESEFGNEREVTIAETEAPAIAEATDTKKTLPVKKILFFGVGAVLIVGIISIIRITRKKK